MGSVNEVVVIVFNTILSKAVPKSLSKRVDLTLGFSKRVAIVSPVFLAFLCLDTSVAGSEDAFGSCP